MSTLKTDKLYSTDRSTGSDENILLNDDGTTNLKGNTTVTGTCAATTFSGSGASLTALPAANLTGALPAISGASLTGISSPLSFRNLIINGNHQISQRHTTKTGVTGEYLTDRWSGWGDAMTFDRVAITSASTGPWTEGHRYSMRVKNEAAGSDATATGQYIRHKVEAQDMAGSGWDYIQASSKIALSFWVKTSVAGTYYGAFWSQDGTAKAYNFSLGALSANTWTKVTKIIPGHADLQFDVNNDTGIILNLFTHRSTNNTASDAVMDSWHNLDYNKTAPDITHAFNTTVNATYEFTGVQLEVGSAATDFEHRSYHDELQRCLRYYWKCGGDNGDSIGISGNAWAANYVVFQVQHPVHMRATPTYLGYNDCRFQAQADSASFDAATMSIQDSTVDGKTMLLAKSGTSGATAGHGGSLNSQEDGMYISFSAEL